MAGENLAFPWARTYDADQLAAFIENLWGAASGDNDLATLDAIEKVIAEHRPDEDDAAAQCPLSERELQVLTELANGESYESAGRNLGITTHSVRSHCHRIIDRLNAKDQAQATAIAAHSGWLPGLRIPHPLKPIPRRSPQQWAAVHRASAAAMREQPGTAVDIGPYTSNTGAAQVARRIREGLLEDFKPAGAFTAQSMRTGPGRWVVRATFIGAPSATTHDTAPGDAR